MDQRKLRKYEHSLVVSGLGIIIFGAWNIIKAVLFFVMTPADQLAATMTAEQKESFGFTGFSNTNIALIMFVGILIGLLVSLAVRYYIGRTAIQEGRRIRRRSRLYIILAILLSMSLAYSIVRGAYIKLTGVQDATLGVFEHTSVSVFVDITSLLCLIEMIISAIMVRRLRKEAE